MVDIGAHRLDGFAKALQFAICVLSHDLRDDHAWLMQHHMAKAHAISDRRTLERDGATRGDFGAGAHDGLQLARCNHLGQQHRNGFENLDLFFRIGALDAVLHDQHAQRIAAAQDRHAKEGIVDLFARLRPVGEGGVGLRVVQRQRLGGFCDQADKALARAHGGLVDGLALQALGGEQLQPQIGAQHIDRAHLRHHVGCDVHDDAIKARLCVHRLRHDFAESAQQQARSAGRAARGHERIVLPPSLMRRPLSAYSQ